MTDKEIKDESTDVKQDVTIRDTPKKCGIVMPIASMEGYSESHWKDVKSIIEEAIKEAGFEARLVSDADDIGVIHKRIVQNLYDNPMIVCDISGRNPNVMFELGLRLAFDKPTLIIKDELTPYSFDTSVIEHLSYPKDLRYQKIEFFKRQLKDRIQKTYKAYIDDPDNYSTFLKNYGDFKTPVIDEETVSIDRFVLEELKELRLSVSSLSKSVSVDRNAPTLLNWKFRGTSNDKLITLKFNIEQVKDTKKPYIDIKNALARFDFSYLIINISFLPSYFYIDVNNSYPDIDIVKEVVSQISGLGYIIEEFDQYHYKLHYDF